MIKYIKESIICFLLGGIPCLWAFNEKGLEGVTALLESIDTSDPVVGYFLILALIQFVFSIVSRWFPKFYDGVKATLNFIYPIINGVGSSLLCLYRVLAGACIGCVIIIVKHYSQLDNLSHSLIFSLAAFVFVLMSYFLDKSYNYAVSNQ
ncbi:hypothetical protein [Pseudoalteromonas sp. C8]|uniref:hypothetical protein n=1 Tax=Pseudoalteromonas sp. C8 TaxID=2686345 RepID=UPI0013FD67C2|nr:hypothetical protein [Pseudoalteromonas sp. C8]